ncbi:neuroligin-4, X-linked-like isoform X1 [Macrobrachium nipponense]|uniref:neuroligin-4, X-linked-like isoform X1 n=1 Tax=Macrobrachium nipponense TaxID=159736 RepID=UPI0030C8BC64
MKYQSAVPGVQIRTLTCLCTFVVKLWIIAKYAECDSMPRTPAIATKYGQLRGFYRQVTNSNFRVATYLGVPYATPPVGANRFSPTRALSQWVGVHEATHFGPSCPQRFPDLSNETAALSRMSRAQYLRLRRYLPVLRRQNEDCLYLNIYVPDEDAAMMAYPVVVFIHGESYEWGSSSLYDGSVLAALGKVIVVTINYRLGILGFFNANVDPVGRATVANYGLMDQLAALHWVQENIVRFGGDPGQVTVMGHGTGAACLNFLVISPAASGAGLFKRAILMSGSALSPWASVREPVHYAIETATQLGCAVPNDLYHNYEKLLHCLRDKSVDQILKVDLKVPEYAAAVGPSVDGVTIKPDWMHQHSKMGKEGRTPVDLLLGMTTANILELFNEDEVQHGFSMDYRERLLRTFVRNNYRFHLQEIMLAITAEYTDWSRAEQHPYNIRDLTAEALHDANIVSPVSMLASQLYTTSRTTYLYVLDHISETHHSEQKNLASTVNELTYVFGGPLGAFGIAVSSTNFTKMDTILSETIISLWTNFMKFGHPNDLASAEIYGSHRDKSRYRAPDWPRFDPNHRKFLEIGSRGRVRDHYRAGTVALWSWLVPGLERVGSRYGPDSSFNRLSNHLQLDTSASTGNNNSLSNQDSQKNSSVPAPPTQASSHPTVVVKANKSQVTASPESAGMRKDFPYTTALSVTVAIACSLLILNMLVLTTVYYRHDASRQNFAKGTHDASSDSGNDVQLHATGDPNKPIYHPAHYGTLRSSATLRSDLATSFEGEPQHEWPPDYDSSCQSADEDTTVVPGRKNSHDIIRGTIPKPPNGPTERRTSAVVLKQPVASYTSPIDGQLSPASYSPDNTSDLQV